MGATSSVLSHKTDAVEGESVVVTKVPDALDVSKVMRGSSMQISSMLQSFAIRQHAEEKFAELDVDGNGVLEGEEIDQVCKYVLDQCLIKNEEVGIHMDSSVMNEINRLILQRVDLNDDGKMDLEEFVDLCEMMSARYALINRAKDKFRDFDPESTGEINSSECIKVIEWALEMNAYIGRHSMENNREKQKYKERLISRLQIIQASGKMTFEQFGLIFEDMLVKLELIDSAKLKFAALDMNDSGTLELSEIDELLSQSMKSFSQKNQNQKDKFRRSFMKKVDENHDNRLDMMEFVNLWENICSRLDLANQYAHLFSRMQDEQLDQAALNLFQPSIEDFVRVWWRTCRYGTEDVMAEISPEKLQKFVSGIMNKERKRKSKSVKSNQQVAAMMDSEVEVAAGRDDDSLVDKKEHVGCIWADNLYEFLWHN